MSGEVQPGERPDAPSGIAAMVALSLFIHGGFILVLAFFAIPTLSQPDEQPFAISLMHPPIDTSSLPVIDGSRDAGPIHSVPEQLIAAPEVEEEPEEKEPEPKVEEKKPEPKREEPKPEPKREEPKVISTKAAPKEEEPEAETAQQLRQRLESSQGVYTTKSAAGGGQEVSHHVALENAGDAGGSGGAPDLFRNRLVALIGQSWNPPRTRPGQVMEAIVEFTIESTPIDDDAVNVNRERARVVDIVMVKSSGDARFDSAAAETVRRLRDLPPLPDYIKGSRLKVSCRFYFIGE